jgi:hypothetical protein
MDTTHETLEQFSDRYWRRVRADKLINDWRAADFDVVLFLMLFCSDSQCTRSAANGPEAPLALPTPARKSSWERAKQQNWTRFVKEASNAKL